MLNSQALGQCKVAPTVDLEPHIEYPQSGALGPASSVRYPVAVTHTVWKGKNIRLYRDEDIGL